MLVMHALATALADMIHTVLPLSIPVLPEDLHTLPRKQDLATSDRGVYKTMVRPVAHTATALFFV